MDLRPYQIQAIDELTQAGADGHRRLLLVAPTGSGKGVIATRIIKSSYDNGYRVLFLTHRREILFQCSAHLKTWGIEHGLILSEEPMEPGKKIQIASVQSFLSTVLRRRKMDLPSADLVIVDECFPGDTRVGGENIRDIQIGDLVPSYENGKIVLKRVIYKFIKNTKELLRIKTDMGNILCTPNHPFLTPNGWRRAIDCLGYMLLCSNHGMSYMREECSIGSKTSAQKGQGLLFSGLRPNPCKQMFLQSNAANQSEIQSPGVPFPAYEEVESDERPTNPSQAKNNFESYGMDAGYSGRERETDPNSTTAIGGALGLGVGIHRAYEEQKREGISHALQNRHSKPGSENRDRGGWNIPRKPESKRVGSKEDGFFNWARVDNIEIQKPGSDGRFGGLCPEGLVYNLEVEDTGTYIADGFVVHNCHHLISSKTWLRALSHYPEAILLGMTATPINNSGGGFKEHFDIMVKCPSITELTGMGHLVPLRYFAPTIPDLQGIRIRAGDYAEDQLEARMDTPKLAGEVCENWSRICPDRKTIVFACGIKHSIHLAESFNKIGIKAAHVDGGTEKEERDKIIESFRNGDLQVLTNCSVFTEGVDIPAASCLIFARPTKSLLLYIQVAGRILRPYPMKENAILIDHGGIVYEHGRIDQDFNWTLDYGNIPKEENLKLKKTREKRQITCKSCKSVYEGRLKCPECGWKPDVHGEPVETYKAYLQEIDALENPPVNKREWWNGLRGYAISKGWKKGWAYWKYKEKFGVGPANAWQQDQPTEPSLEVKSWIQYQNIKWAKRKQNERQPQQPVKSMPEKIASHGYERIDKLANNAYQRDLE